MTSPAADGKTENYSQKDCVICSGSGYREIPDINGNATGKRIICDHGFALSELLMGNLRGKNDD